MAKTKYRIIDLHHRAGTALPASNDIFFQCQRCWDVIPSLPADSLYCSCKNVSVDVDAGRAGARDESLMRVLQIIGVPKT